MWSLVKVGFEENPPVIARFAIFAGENKQKRLRALRPAVLVRYRLIHPPPTTRSSW